MKVYGYCRISTNKQNIERQERNIKAAFPDAVIIREAYSGAKVEGRKAFENLRIKAECGDTIVFDSVSRMSRNAVEGFKIYKELYERGVELVFLKEPQINTSTYKNAQQQSVAEVNTGDDATDALINAVTQAVSLYVIRLAEKQILLAFEQAEKEVADLHQRTREGIETARLAGKQIGMAQGKKLNVKKAAAAKEAIRKYSKDFDGTLNDKDAIVLVGVARNTYYKYKKELLQELISE